MDDKDIQEETYNTKALSGSCDSFLTAKDRQGQTRAAWNGQRIEKLQQNLRNDPTPPEEGFCGDILAVYWIKGRCLCAFLGQDSALFVGLDRRQRQLESDESLPKGGRGSLVKSLPANFNLYTIIRVSIKISIFWFIVR
ncbi:hypothetical protein RRG08_043287 [Elysia crispata]|uniref:Uncharacterized protein n=1 Tax=Elysia crispata TaxID=231223 RepID=A0AAE1CP72_9GAST|nr:hypothetical protein RRG08_043287 [Elysia crispata]